MAFCAQDGGVSELNSIEQAIGTEPIRRESRLINAVPQMPLIVESEDVEAVIPFGDGIIHLSWFSVKWKTALRPLKNRRIGLG